jgi:hypothetical protein
MKQLGTKELVDGIFIQGQIATNAGANRYLCRNAYSQNFWGDIIWSAHSHITLHCPILG